MKCIFNMFRLLKISLFIILFSFTVSTGVAKDKSSSLVDFRVGKGLSSQILLTKEEQAWLDHRHPVRVRIGNAPPYHMSTPEPQGISVDYLKLIGKRFGIHFTFTPSPIGWAEAVDDLTGERKWFDLLITMKRTPEREKEIAFTQEYLFSPWVIINRTDTVFVSRMEDLNGKNVAVEQGYVIKDRIKDEYPQIKIVFFDKTLDALQSVATGHSDAYVGNLTIATYLIQKNGLNNLKIAAPTPFGSHDQAMGVRRDWPELVSIINKALKAMSDAEKNEIHNRWLSVRYEYGINMKKVLSWIAGLTAIFLLIIVITVVWNRKLKREIERRVKAEKALSENELRYRTVADFTSDWEYWIMPDGTFRYISPSCQKISGYAPDEFIADPELLTRMIHPDDLNLYADHFHHLSADGPPEPIDYRILTKNGEYRWISHTCQPVYDAAGQANGRRAGNRDITGRKRVEEALREANDYLDKLIGYANAPIIVWDTKFIITRFNHAFEDLTGLKAQEVLGKEIDLLFPEERREESLGYIRQTTGGERWEVIEIPILRRDGSVRTVIWNSATIYSPNGKTAIATIAQGQDITDRKRTEEAQVRLVAMLDATPGFVGYADARDTHILYINTAGRKMVGVQEQEDVTQLKITDVHPEWTNKLFRDEIIPTAIRDGLWTGECAFLNRDGHEIPVMMALLAHKLPNGELERFSTVSIDITDRKRAEEQIHRHGRLLAAINSVFYETLTADSEGMVAKTCLKVAQEITDSKFGFIGEITPEDLFTTTALSDPGWEVCRIPETQANVLIKDMVIRGIWGQVLLKEQSLIVNDPVSYPDRVGIPEGHPPLTSFLGVPLKDQGKVIGMIAMGNRISGYAADHQQDMEALSVAFVEALRRKRAEEEIRKLNTELEQRVLDRTAQLSASNKELEAFSYSVSHDLRAPLRSIDGFSQALLEEYQDKPLDGTGKTFLERVRKASQRMGLLIDDMLKLSRITQAEMKREPVDLSVMVREIAEAYQKSNPDKAADVTVQEGVRIQGDPYLMRIALENLVGNAFKFTGREAHPRIEFGTAVRNGETACFIRDNGAGFEMAYVSKLFGAFQRLHTTDEFPGTGIGLATVQRIINRHGGRVWAEGEKGKGATFRFTLPS